jgi:hypothetical protein
MSLEFEADRSALQEQKGRSRCPVATSIAPVGLAMPGRRKPDEGVSRPHMTAVMAPATRRE